jgi:hypothetical protein
MASSAAKDDKDLPGLVTRHVFLDTQAYRANAHDLSSGPFKALAGLIEEDRVSLHTTDVTLQEIGRQIAEEIADIERELGELRKRREHWDRRFARAQMPQIATVDAAALAQAAVPGFTSTIQIEWSARTHNATAVDPRVIFEKYFDRKPPFDATKSKEFPDAFVIEALANWCKENRATMYVVTADAAAGRAAEETGVLIPVKSLQDLLAIATEAETPELTFAIDQVIERQEFRDKLQEYINEHFGWLGTTYLGNYVDGEIIDTEVADDVEILKFSIISADEDTIGIIFSVRVPVDVTFQYVDEGASWYDSEAGKWHYDDKVVGTFEDDPTIRVYVELDRHDMSVADMSILTTDVYLSEPYETYK